MRTQIEMYDYLKENVSSHNLKITDNVIVGKKRIKSRSFSSFKITYLKNGEVSIKSTSYPSRTIRYSNEKDLFCHMGSFSNIKY